MKISRQRRLGLTLAEITMSLTCGGIILAAVITAGVALQRSFAAVEGYSIAEGDQLRIQDYIAMDCRRAVSATVNSTTNTLTLTVPNYYDASGNPQNPTYSSTYGIQYGSTGGTTTIKYYRSGSNFTREVAGVAKPIATNVSTFTVTAQDLTSSVTCSITFAPRFTNLPGPGPVAGTTVYCNTFLRNAIARQ